MEKFEHMRYLLRTERVVLLEVLADSGCPLGISTLLLATHSMVPLSLPLS